ncbi:MAG: NUDIX hydrolase [Myxococcales bacterium]|nr:NUDIX hydrolase [Myxococcales bacterium]
MAIELEIVEDRAAATPSDAGFLKVRRLRLRAHYPSGTSSEVFSYDVADRAALDAVCVVLWSPNPERPEDPLVLVRTALRPPLRLRRDRTLTVPDRSEGLELWELPAGLIELSERGEAGVIACGARETEEETGVALDHDRFERLGVPVFLSPGMCGEKIHLLVARVDDRSKTGSGAGDGVLEQGARCEWWPLSVCLARADEGVIEDAKTELGLLRFARRLAQRG